MIDPRDKILHCACDLYLESGLDGFSMRKLAKQVGVTAPALYRHYEGKEYVLTDVVREAYRQFTGYLYRALEAPTPVERFFAAGEGYLDFALGHRRWYAIMFTGAERLGMEAMPDDVEAMGCAIHQFWEDRVRECMAAGILAVADPQRTSITMWAHAHGMIQLHHQGHFRMQDAEFRALFEESGARMMRGVATREFAAELTARYIVGDAAAEVGTHDGTWRG